jgi:hypothetical protein
LLVVPTRWGKRVGNALSMTSSKLGTKNSVSKGWRQ